MRKPQISKVFSSTAIKRLPLIMSTVLLTTPTVFAADRQAWADDAPLWMVLEEITVVARKREESLQETPVAVSVFSARELEQRNLTNLIETGAYAPNVSMATGQAGNGGGNNGQFFIRGVGQYDFLFTVDPGVGIYIDGVYHPRALGSVIDVLDLERIEILRGPQGTLFGKNTIGGAINLISTPPSEDFSGYAEVSVGDYERRDFRGSINLPLIEDKLFGRFALSSKKQEGYGDRLDFETKQKILSGLGDEEQIDIRGGIKWLVTEEVTATLRADYTKENENSVPIVLLSYDGNNGAALPNLWNTFVGAAQGEAMSDAYIIPGNKEDSYATGPNGNTLEGGGVGLTLDWNFPTAKLRSITAYRQMDSTFGADDDGSPLPIESVDQAQKEDQFSQELQLISNDSGSFQWLAGLYYFEEYGQDLNTVRLVSGLYDALLASGLFDTPEGQAIALSLDLDLDIFNEIDITSAALFGQAEFEISDQLTATLGLRQTREEKEYKLIHRRVNSNTFTVTPAPATLSESWSAFTPMVNLRYQWNGDLMTYATISRGFKSGGFNGRPLSSIEEVAPFDPEFVLNYELGMKSQWFDNRLRLNIAGFFYDYTDMQFTKITANASNNLVITVGNVGEAKAKGLELELQGNPAVNLQTGLTLGYIDFEITKLDAGADVSIDAKQVRTPEWTASAFVQYRWQLQQLANVIARADWTYEDESFSDIQNSPIIARDANTVINARVTADFTEQNWQLALFVTNLTNERYLVSGVYEKDAFGRANGFYNPPRQWGLSLKKSF